MLADLTLQERELILELLTRELSDLGPEIRHTDDREFRDELRERRDVVRHLTERLEALQPTS
jgi:hypothetical protein